MKSVASLCRMLKVSQSITALDLSCAFLGPSGGHALAVGLKPAPPCLICLDVRQNALGWTGVRDLAHAATGIRSLTSLNLAHNAANEHAAAEMLGTLLKVR